MKDDRDVAALFQLPLTEFTQARNALASRLKKDGRDDEAARVKAIVKPSISAWAANQLYWRHRQAFTDLIEAGRRLIQAQASQLAGKAADLKLAQAERREALSTLSRLADALLREAGHQPAPDTMRRVNSTLEALSTYSPASDAAPIGRLSEDLNPTGFEAIAALIPSAAGHPVKSTRVIPFKPRANERVDPRKPEEDAGIASTRIAFQAAEEALQIARRSSEALAAAKEEAAAEVAETGKDVLVAEKRYEAARLAEQEARRRLRHATAEAEKAARIVGEAERAVEKARADLKRKQGS